MRILALVIHGIGSQQPGYSVAMRDLVHQSLTARGADAGAVLWEEVYWQDVLAGRQQQFLAAATSALGLRLGFARNIVVNALGDAAAYQRTKGGPRNTYDRIHGRVADALRSGLDRAADDPVAVVALAHSLGGHIFSNFVWDEQHRTALGPSGWRSRLAGIITFGCNIPLFTFAVDPVLPIAFPDPSLDPELVSHAEWNNYLGLLDYLGYPLRTINDAYAAVVTTDEVIGVGGGALARLVSAHEQYWTSDPLVDRITRYLERLIAV